MQSLEERVRELYDTFGQRKPMGHPEHDKRRPLFFLHRTFLGDQDLLFIFNTRRCRYQCDFCQVPAKSSKEYVPAEDIIAQFEYVITELKHSLSILTRVTLSNEGSVLDTETFPTEALLSIGRGIRELRLVRRIVLETRLEFVDPPVIELLREASPPSVVDVLAGFETLSPEIREGFLGKQESIDQFLAGLDMVRDCRCALTAYVLYKPSPYMTDAEAFSEAEASMDFLASECGKRQIPLTIRLNPMYAARGSPWAALARQNPAYAPPRLTDVMALAEKKANEGFATYIDLSSEGLDEAWGTYSAREDYSPALIKPIKLFNDGKIKTFNL